MNRQLNHILGAFFCLVMLAACSSSDEKNKAKPTHTKVLYVELGKQQIAFNAEPNSSDDQQTKWVGNYKEVIYTQSGRIRKTEHFTLGNLVFSYANSPDPLSLNLLKSSTPKTWTWLVDWSPMQMGITLESSFEKQGSEEIDLPDKIINTDTVLFEEKVVISALNISYYNKYWLDKATGKVVKSVQNFNPNHPPITLTLSGDD